MKKVLFVLLTLLLVVGCIEKETIEGNQENQGINKVEHPEIKGNYTEQTKMIFTLNKKDHSLIYAFFEYVEGGYKADAFDIYLDGKKIVSDISGNLEKEKPIIIKGEDNKEYFAFEYSTAAMSAPYATYYIFDENGKQLDEISILSSDEQYYDGTDYWYLDKNGEIIKDSNGSNSVIIDGKLIFLSKYKTYEDAKEYKQGNILYKHELIINDSKVTYKILEQHNGF